MTIDGDVPRRVTQLSGALISGNPPGYVLEAVRDEAGDMVWFGRFEGERSGDDPPPTRIIDTLDVPEHPADHGVQLIDCGPRGHGTAPEIFALVKVARDAPTYPVVRAWRADRESQRITEVPPADIQCDNAGYGA